MTPQIKSLEEYKYEYRGVTSGGERYGTIIGPDGEEVVEQYEWDCPSYFPEEKGMEIVRLLNDKYNSNELTTLSMNNLTDGDWGLIHFNNVTFENFKGIERIEVKSVDSGSISLDDSNPRFPVVKIPVVGAGRYKRLEAKLKIAVDALEFYKTNAHTRITMHPGTRQDIIDKGDVAKLALAKIKGE